MIKDILIKCLPRLTFDNGGSFDEKLELDSVHTFKEYFKKRNMIKNADTCIPLDENDLSVELRDSLYEAKAALSAIVMDRKWEYGGKYHYRLIGGELELFICTPATLYHSSVGIRYEAAISSRPGLCIDFDLKSRKCSVRFWLSMFWFTYHPQIINVPAINEMKNLLELIYNEIILKDSFELYDN